MRRLCSRKGAEMPLRRHGAVRARVRARDARLGPAAAHVLLGRLSKDISLPLHRGKRRCRSLLEGEVVLNEAALLAGRAEQPWALARSTTCRRLGRGQQLCRAMVHPARAGQRPRHASERPPALAASVADQRASSCGACGKKSSCACRPPQQRPAATPPTRCRRAGSTARRFAQLARPQRRAASSARGAARARAPQRLDARLAQPSASSRTLEPRGRQAGQAGRHWRALRRELPPPPRCCGAGGGSRLMPAGAAGLPS